MNTRPDYPIVNAAEHAFADNLFLMWAGAYGDTRGYVWADSDEAAFEAWVEYLDDHAPGLLVSHEEFRELLDEAAKEAGFASFGAVPEGTSEFASIVEDAEGDLTVIGHTSLKRGAHIPSWEWGFDEVTDASEFDAVQARSELETDTE